MDSQRPGSGSQKLETWQQIADYLDVSVRTAQYWKQNKGLPVRRSNHAGRVIAYQVELDRWLEAGLGVLMPEQATTPQPGVTQSPPRPPFLTFSMLLGCALYAGAYAAGLMAEVSYAFDRYAATAGWVAAIIFLWVLGTTLLASRFSLDRPGVALPVAVLLMSAAILYLGVCFYLPSHPLTQQATQAQPANVAYLKGILYILPIAIFFQLIPVQFAASMKRELASGRVASIRALFAGDKMWAAPNRVIYLPLKALWSILLLAAAISIPMTAALFSSLKPSPYQGMFIHWIQLRNLFFFGFALQCLVWYYRALNELKSGCIASGSGITVAG